ncbi:Crp/Fnr family transcriptional regulator [Nocardiopsis halophila]
MRQGDPGSTVHLVAEGQARVVRVRADGITVPLAFRGAGEVLGEPMLLPGGGARSATVTAVGHCATAVFPVERFRRIVREHGLENALWESTLVRQMESDTLRAEQAALPVERRAAGPHCCTWPGPWACPPPPPSPTRRAAAAARCWCASRCPSRRSPTSSASRAPRWPPPTPACASAG